MADLDDVPTGPLNAKERRAVRVLLLRHERKTWLFRQCGIWLRWVSVAPSIGAGLYFIWVYLSPLIAKIPHK